MNQTLKKYTGVHTYKYTTYVIYIYMHMTIYEEKNFKKIKQKLHNIGKS